MITVHPEWYEKLGRWDDALTAYQLKQLEEPRNLDVTLGRMRCLNSLGEWEQLAALASDVWGARGGAGGGASDVDDATEARIAVMGAHAAWALGDWDNVAVYVEHTQENRFQGAFMRAVLSIHRGHFDVAEQFIERSRLLVESMLTPLVGESYNRAYKQVVKVQQLAEVRWSCGAALSRSSVVYIYIYIYIMPHRGMMMLCAVLSLSPSLPLSHTHTHAHAALPPLPFTRCTRDAYYAYIYPPLQTTSISPLIDGGNRQLQTARALRRRRSGRGGPPGPLPHVAPPHSGLCAQH